jgi:hypothetical protein
VSDTNYYQDAWHDAVEMAIYFKGDISEMLLRDGEASTDLFNDYNGGDEYHHENHVDRSYGLLEAATLLDELHRWEEDDSGLWDGLSPRDAVSAQAAYTYGNAVCSLWSDLIGIINADFERTCEVDKVFSALREAGEDDSGLILDWLTDFLAGSREAV